MTKRNIDPVFKHNYRGYDKEEFLIDSNMEFFKIKKLLEKNPKVLKDDPLLSIDYMKMINLIKRKRLVEETSDAYSPTDQYDSTYLDLDSIQYEKGVKGYQQAERFLSNMEMEQA